MHYDRLKGSNLQPPNLMCTSGTCNTVGDLPVSAFVFCYVMVFACHQPFGTRLYIPALSEIFAGSGRRAAFMHHITLWALGTMSFPFLCDTLIAQVVMTANSFVWSFISMPHTPQDDAAAKRVRSSTASFGRSWCMPLECVMLPISASTDTVSSCFASLCVTVTQSVYVRRRF